MSGESSFPYRKYDRKPNPNIVKQILDDSELIELGFPKTFVWIT